MKKKIVLILITLLSVVLLAQTSYAGGLMYETKMLAGNKIRVTVKWINPKEAKGITLSYFSIENGKTLNIGYELKEKAPKTFTLDYDLKSALPPIRIILSKSGDLKWRPFKDIYGIEAEKDIRHLHDANIIEHGNTVNFRPNAMITRAEFAELICRTLKLSGTTENPKKVKDIEKLKEKKYILTAVKKGIMSTYKDKTFKPRNPMTVAEVSMCITKNFKFKTAREGFYLKLKKDKPYSASVKKIFDLNILDVNDSIYKNFNEESKISRANCAMMLSRALSTY